VCANLVGEPGPDEGERDGNGVQSVTTQTELNNDPVEVALIHEYETDGSNTAKIKIFRI
jgi:hypothetical protein